MKIAVAAIAVWLWVYAPLARWLVIAAAPWVAIWAIITYVWA